MTAATPRPPPENESAGGSGEPHGAVFQSAEDFQDSDHDEILSPAEILLRRSIPNELATATTSLEMLQAIGKGARDLAIHVRHGGIDFYEAEEGLLALAEARGLQTDVGLHVVELAIHRGLRGAATDSEPPPPDGPEDYGLTPDAVLAAAAATGLDISVAPLTLAEWAARELSPPDCLLGSWLTTTTRVLFVGDTGLGKTTFLLGLGLRCAAGAPFLHWNSHRPRRVLYIDGEMSRRLLKKRLEDETKRFGSAPEGFHAISHEDIEGFAPLNTPAGQACIEKIIAKIGRVDLIIFDSIMCLTVGDMKDEESWQQTLPWVRSLTRRSTGQIWAHHTGHDATRSYGTKTREWQMDTVAIIEAIARPDTDVSFIFEFRKARERTPETRADFQDVKIAIVNDDWQHEASQVERHGHVPPLAQKFLDALNNTLAGDVIEKINGRRAVSTETWKAECKLLGLIDPKAKPDSARTLFNANKRQLIAGNRIGCEREFQWTI